MAHVHAREPRERLGERISAAAYGTVLVRVARSAIEVTEVGAGHSSELVFGVGVVFALLGLVLYNTRIAALAVPLLVLSLARPVPGGR